ncbi:MAG: Ig domain-containing protein [Candidatus Sulfotelmatobacter sp.]|jgi:hypothetical protein
MKSRSFIVPWLLAIAAFVESGCGGGKQNSQPPPRLSISTESLPDGMATFPYSQAILANGGVPPFVWNISSGSLPHNVMLASSSGNSVTLSGTPDTPQTGTFAIQVKDANGQGATKTYTINIAANGSLQLQTVSGQVPAGTIELQGLSAGSFNPVYWQKDTLNWVPDVRVPMLAPQPGPFQNIYAPWPLEQAGGWRLFYGGWDGTDTSNDRVYSVTTSDFLTFNNRVLVIDHGAFLHVNNGNVTQLPDGSMHMICTIAVDQTSNGKPAYFSSPDGIVWNGTPEPYPAQLTDVVSVENDPLYPGYDYNGGNVLLRDNGRWTLYYSDGIYGGSGGAVYRATTTGSPPVFQSAGSSLATQHYSNDVKKLTVSGKDWYLMALYIERVATDPNPPSFSYSLSNDGVQFGPEQTLFGGAYPQDQFLVTPAFVTRGTQILGVLYGGNPVDLLNPQDAIFARWLQKRIVFEDSSGNNYVLQGGFGPDRQWFQVPVSGSLQGTIWVYAEDGVTPLASGPANLNGGNAYQVLLGGS